MKKRILRWLGGILLLCGIFMVIFAGEMAEVSKPSEVVQGMSLTASILGRMR